LNWQDVEQNWPWFKLSAQLRWDRLSSPELCRIGGDRIELIGRIQQAYAVSRAEADRQVSEWLARLNQYSANQFSAREAARRFSSRRLRLPLRALS